MDFFQFATYAELFVPLNMDPNGVVDNRLWICLLVGGLCFLVVYVFEAIGLYTIAKREGYGNKWMAFVPFFNLYYIGVCSHKNKVYAFDAKKFAIICVAVELLLVSGYVLYYVSAFKVWDYIYWEHTTVGDVIFTTAAGFSGLPDSMAWMGWIYQYLNDYVLYWIELIFIIVKLLLLMSFFKTYSASHYLMFSFVGALLPLTGILIYAVRNNKAINYADYIRRLREREYRIYQQQYGNYNPYGGNAQAPDPFGEYGSSQGRTQQGGYSQGGYSQGSAQQGGDSFGFGGSGSPSASDGSDDAYGSDSSSGNSSSDRGSDSPFDDFK